MFRERLVECGVVVRNWGAGFWKTHFVDLVGEVDGGSGLGLG